MNFELDDEEQLLAGTVRDLLDKYYGSFEERSLIVAGEPGWSRDVWATLAEIGLLGLTFPEEAGGMGAGAVESMLVLTEFGRRLAPEPLLDSVLVPGGLLAEAGTDDRSRALLSDLAAGRRSSAFAHREPGGRWPEAPVATSATRGRDGWRLTGTKNPVLRGDCADTIVASAVLPDGGVGLFLVDTGSDGVSRIPYRTHDGLRGAQFELADAAADPVGEPVDRTRLIERGEVRAHAGLCAEAVGAMSEVLRMTCDYLKTRKQFGVPLAAFQTLTQRAADMYVALELARSLSLYASMSIADGLVDPVVASRARLQVSRSARLIGQEAIQMHGGIGLTAEYPVAHYVSRLTAIEHTLGGGDDHLRRISRGVCEYEMVTVGGA